MLLSLRCRLKTRHYQPLSRRLVLSLLAVIKPACCLFLTLLLLCECNSFVLCILLLVLLCVLFTAGAACNCSGEHDNTAVKCECFARVGHGACQGGNCVCDEGFNGTRCDRCAT